MKKQTLFKKTIITLLLLPILITNIFFFSDKIPEFIYIIPATYLLIVFFKNFIGIEFNLSVSIFLFYFLVPQQPYSIPSNYKINLLLLTSFVLLHLFFYTYQYLLNNHKLHTKSKQSLILSLSSLTTFFTLTTISKIIAYFHLPYPKIKEFETILIAIFITIATLLIEKQIFSQEINSIKKLSIQIIKPLFLAAIIYLFSTLEIPFNEPILVAIILILIYLCGKYTGLRLVEVYRFRSLIFKRK